MDQQNWSFKIKGLSSLNEGEYTSFMLNSIERAIPYQENRELNLEEKNDEIKF